MELNKVSRTLMKILILEANPYNDLSLDKEIRELVGVINESSGRKKF